MGEVLTGINIATQVISNMAVDTICVAADAVNLILNETKLTGAEQEEAVNELVDRNRDWLELEQEIQMEKIEIALVQATVVKHLTDSEIIRSDCYGYNVGMRPEDGSIVVEASYIRMNREERRQWIKRSKKHTRKGSRIQTDRIDNNE